MAITQLNSCQDIADEFQISLTTAGNMKYYYDHKNPYSEVQPVMAGGKMKDWIGYNHSGIGIHDHYLVGNRTSYFVTDYKPTNKTSIRAIVEFANTGSDTNFEQFMFGSRTSATSTFDLFVWYMDLKQYQQNISAKYLNKEYKKLTIEWPFNTKTLLYFNFYNPYNLTQRIMKFQAVNEDNPSNPESGGKIYYNDFVTNTQSFTGSYPIAIMSVNTMGNSKSAYICSNKVKLYQFTIYEANKPVRNYIAVPDYNGSLKDTLSGKILQHSGGGVLEYH